jgi:hypothetical protein
MLIRDFDTIFDGWDEPPGPCTGRPWPGSDERLAQAQARVEKNSSQQVIFEIGLVIVAPLILAVAVGLLLPLGF